MTDEEKNEQDEAAEEAPAAEDAPAEEAAPEEAPAEEAAPEEAPAEDAPAEDAPAEEAPAADAGEPEEALSPKERRRAERSRGPGRPRPASPEERAELRRKKRAARGRWRRSRRERDKKREKTAPLEPVAREAGAQRTRQGIVVSAKPDKTITVRIDVARRHRRYEKVVRESSTLHVHDEKNEAREGDTVRVVESRPLSRTKRWRLVEILERAR